MSLICNRRRKIPSLGRSTSIPPLQATIMDVRIRSSHPSTHFGSDISRFSEPSKTSTNSSTVLSSTMHQQVVAMRKNHAGNRQKCLLISGDQTPPTSTTSSCDIHWTNNNRSPNISCFTTRSTKLHVKSFLKTLFAAAIIASICQEGVCIKQSFRVRPQDVAVVAGSDIILPCEVNNQQGDAQWTRRGFALGFDRSIVAVDNIRMIGDASAGVHNLEIKNVTLEDDGEFQCQVTPYNNAAHIRTRAKVDVLLPPSELTLDGRSGHSQITVSAGTSKQLNCFIQLAKPVPEVIWQRNGVNLPTSMVTSTGEPADDGVRASLRSRITLNPTNEDNGVNYTCLAKHAALTELGVQMSASVTLDVHYPPGAPEIQGYSERDIVRAGDRKVLTCRSRGGNPVPDVFWYKNGVLIDQKYNKHERYATNKYEFTVEASDNKAKYECQVRNVMTTEPKKASIRLRVHFPPSSVTITAPENAKVGDLIDISCVAENSNPAADVTLMVNRNPPSGVATSNRKGENGGITSTSSLTSYEIMPTEQDLLIDCYAHNHALGKTEQSSKTVTVIRPPGPPVIIGYDGRRALRKGDRHRLTCSSAGGNPPATLKWFKGDTELSSSTLANDRGVAESHLDVLLEASDNEAVYRCEASNPATIEPLVNATVLKVQFPPASVHVDISPKPVHSGSFVNLTCESSTSYPMANVTWWRAGQRLDGGIWDVKNGDYGGTVTVYTLSITVKAEDDHAIYTCQADNGLPPSTHDAITLDIMYKPTWYDGPEQLPATLEVTEGTYVMLNASAHGKPSNIIYTWRKGGDVVGAGKSLNLSAIERSQSGLYVVEATNNEGSAFRNITINVRYLPIISNVSAKQKVNLHSSVELVCQVEGVPTPTISWERDGYDFGSKTVQTLSDDGLRSVLTITRVTRNDTGLFQCSAKNDVGSHSTNVTLIVNHEPFFDPSPRYQRAGADKGATGRLVCRATGSPYVTFEWYTKTNTAIEKDQYPTWDNRYSVEDTVLVNGLSTFESVLVIKDVRSSDYGNFTCSIFNADGSSTTVIVLEGATPPDPPTNVKVLNATHDTVVLEWTPGYDGGLKQKFRIRFYSGDSERYQYMDVYPDEASSFILTGLAISTTYTFAVQGINDKGESAFSSDNVKVTTDSQSLDGLGDPPTGEVSNKAKHRPRTPSLLVAIITLVGAALLVLNVVLVACFFKRRASKRLNKPSASTSDKGSSKSTTLEMYAPSSYNGTVNGETLSSISEKSRESYAQENDSADEYDIDAARVAATSSYLIDQLEPPPQYASGRRNAPLHILTNPVSAQHNNLDFDHDDSRNQYNASLDRTGTTYGTLGRRQQRMDPPDLYSPASEPPLSANRYNTYHPSQYPGAHHHPQIHGMPPNPQQNGTLHRTQAPKLQFPKDYIRNGSMATMNIPVSPNTPGVVAQSSQQPPSQQQPGGTIHPQYQPHGLPPQSGTPTRPMPGPGIGQPMLTTFSGDHTPPTTTLPIEQRGHLV